jgi:hypothetical protein
VAGRDSGINLWEIQSTRRGGQNTERPERRAWQGRRERTRLGLYATEDAAR